jgi:hypothetical protein
MVSRMQVFTGWCCFLSFSFLFFSFLSLPFLSFLFLFFIFMFWSAADLAVSFCTFKFPSSPSSTETTSQLIFQFHAGFHSTTRVVMWHSPPRAFRRAKSIPGFPPRVCPNAWRWFPWGPCPEGSKMLRPDSLWTLRSKWMGLRPDQPGALDASRVGAPRQLLLTPP